MHSFYKYDHSPLFSTHSVSILEGLELINSLNGSPIDLNKLLPIKNFHLIYLETYQRLLYKVPKNYYSYRS